MRRTTEPKENKLYKLSKYIRTSLYITGVMLLKLCATSRFWKFYMEWKITVSHDLNFRFIGIHVITCSVFPVRGRGKSVHDTVERLLMQRHSSKAFPLLIRNQVRPVLMLRSIKTVENLRTHREETAIFPTEQPDNNAGCGVIDWPPVSHCRPTLHIRNIVLKENVEMCWR